MSETSGSRRIEAVCRGVPAFTRGDMDGWVRLFYARPIISATEVAVYLASPATSRTDGGPLTAHATVQLPTGGGEHAADPAL